jgi:hypothetical protein
MIVQSKKCATLVLACLATLPALAAPPAAPQVTVGADIKQLRFDWEIVPQSNSYEFWFKANDRVPYVKFSESRPWQPRATNSISAHLLDWDQARYQIKACNPSGCSASAPIPVAAYMADTIGYFKARRLHNNGRLGIAVALSEDGNTMAAFSAEETVPDFPKAALYVFAKIDGRWRQQARFIPESGVESFSNVGIRPGVDPTLSLSADGNVLAAGMAFRNSSGVDSAGVTVYRRSAGQWTQEYQNIHVQTFAGYVGSFIAEMDEAGEHILFRPGGFEPVEMLVRTASGWTSQPLQQPSTDLREGYYCAEPSLSGNGQSIAWACTRLLQLNAKLLFVSRPPGWQLTGGASIDFPQGHLINRVAIDYSGTMIAVSSGASVTPIADSRNQVRVYRADLNDPNQFESWEPIRAGDWNTVGEGRFGWDLALSRDGRLLAILDPRDTGAGTGVLSPPLQPGTEPTGATYVYELRAQGPRLRRVLKPNNPIPAGGLNEGKVRFARNGGTLVVSEPEEPGSSQGIDGDRTAGGRIRTGALWLY